MIAEVIQPKAKDLGDNFVVRRAIPQLHRKMVGPFVFWDHMGPVEINTKVPMGVRAHPHIGLSTITYLFSGEIIHRDSLGNEQAIRPGEVNWMTAGRGIVHSERSEKNAQHTLEGIQLWVALPEASAEVEPSFVHEKEDRLPLIDHNGWQLRLIAGEALGEKSPLPVFSPLFYLEARTEAGGDVEVSVGENQEGAMYIIKGEVEVDGKTYKPTDLIIFEPGHAVKLSAPDSARVMIFGGEIFASKPTVYWNFVSHSKERLEKAKNDWREGNFPDVINESERIPLPKD